MTQDEIIKEWVTALRSGEIPQGTSVLARPNGERCCLGVLCDIAVKYGVIPPPTLCAEGTYDYGEEGAKWETSKVPPQKVQDWVGLENSAGFFDPPSTKPRRGLAERNDLGFTFNKIADIIESRPKGLFVD